MGKKIQIKRIEDIILSINLKKLHDKIEKDL
jgi:hypothetical protein